MTDIPLENWIEAAVIWVLIAAACGLLVDGVEYILDKWATNRKETPHD